MAWNTYNLYRFTVNSNNYYFAPTELVGTGAVWDEGVNQVVQEAENGEIRVLSLDSNARVNYTFRIKRMPWASRTVGSFTISGMNNLLTMIRTDANYRENTIEFWDRTTSVSGTKDDDVRFWASSFSIEEALRASATANGDPGTVYFGTGQETITFRKEIS